MSEAIESIKDRVIRGRKAETVDEVRKALDAGIEPVRILKEALIPAMSTVGQKYSSGEYFLPHMMIAARAMGEAVEILKPLLVGAAAEKRAKVVIGTVAGDFHDIGKNIVKMMLEGAGYEVIDLGVDASAEAFLEAIARESPRFVLMSALITLTMESMRKTVQAMREAGVRERVLVGVGGAPVTRKFADEIGAEIYGADAYECVEACNRMLH